MNEAAGRRVMSLSHLSALHVPPHRFVELAAAGGFDAVGVRVAQSGESRGYALPSGSAALRDTRSALSDNGLRVLDVEVVKLHAGSTSDDWTAVMEAGAELGAEYLLVTVLDDDLPRAAAVLSHLAASASEYGLRCCLEPMVFSSVRDVRAATKVLDGIDAGLLVDTLHFARAGSTPSDLNPVSRQRFPYFQICDASFAGPAADPHEALSEARTDRLAPGDGVLPLLDIVRALPRTAAVSVEAPSTRGIEDPGGWTSHLGASTRALLTRADDDVEQSVFVHPTEAGAGNGTV